MLRLLLLITTNKLTINHEQKLTTYLKCIILFYSFHLNGMCFMTLGNSLSKLKKGLK